MHPPPVYWSRLKRSFWRSDFLLKYHQNPKVQKRLSWKERERERERKGKRKRKVPKVSSNKGEVNILRREDTSTSKIFFDVISFSPPPSYHFKNPF
jgi:hypothetical protein